MRSAVSGALCCRRQDGRRPSAAGCYASTATFDLSAARSGNETLLVCRQTSDENEFLILVRENLCLFAEKNKNLI